MKHHSTSLRLASLAAGLLLLSTAPAVAQTAYGLISTSATASSLVTFDVTAPNTFTSTVPIIGLAAGQVLVGMDSRPNTGQLYVAGYSVTAMQVQLYVLNVTTGVLTQTGGTVPVNLGSNLGRIGFDFNPTVDRIRLTGSNNTNYRLNPVTGALAATDGNLAYATTDANAGQSPGVGTVAYTNSYIGATATTLYDIDEANSRLTLQNPPNNGTLNTVGSLGIPTSGTTFNADLDIRYNPSTGTNQAYLSVSTSGTVAFTNQLYTVNLTTGATTLVGGLGSAGSGGSQTAFTDIALQITRTVPPTVTGNLAYALAGTNLLSFDTALPGTIRTSVGLTGMAATQTLVGLDIRPATNTLYALGYDAALAAPGTNAQVYAVNAVTGVATAVGTAVRLELGTGKVGFDFNPMVDRIRVVASNRANYRLNPLDGTIAGTDTQLAYATTDANAAATPNIGAVAYTNSVAGATAAATTLYNYDLSLNILTTQNPPNNGTLNTVGTTGITANATASSLDLDIYSSVAGTNTAYLVANPGTTANTNFYTVNLTTGATTLVGAIGNGLAARDIAVAGPAGVVTAVRERTDLASGVSLYPNPAHGSTALTFTLPRAGRAELSVFDNTGRRVATQTAELLPAGPQALNWNTGTVKPGLYFVRLMVDGQATATRQLAVE
ncbi:DUF4394 domain-containing protein [Hymenobacter negativus]|uniref:DUF4394 domain-containing protein n=1 Tax=Hymenobacter negativus TaxID=2795026 RepID=A0ABS3QN73_9BACT|nr:DUF4394 domain-containing protein [Hymenobacter negativus]MBO2012736.1 DUF4394 domain-containing protein [Hymenobacter negativus]